MHFDDASKALVELAASRHNAFHTNEVAGIPHYRLRRGLDRGELNRLYPRVWAVTALGSPPGQALRAATLAVGGSAACHLSSAWLHQWLPRPPTHAIWVPGSGRRRRPGVEFAWCQQIDPKHDIVEVDGIRTLNQAATLCLLGRVVDAATLERCVDDFTRTHSSRWLFETMDRLATANSAGVAALARVLNHPRRVAGVTESWFERVMAQLVARSIDVVAQHWVETDGGRYRLDLAVPDVRVGIEAHSRTYHWGPRREDADNVRDLHLAAAGWEVLYVTWSQLKEPEVLVDRLGQIVARRRREAA